jgi:hypothetical protein
MASFENVYGRQEIAGHTRVQVLDLLPGVRKSRQVQDDVRLNACEQRPDRIAVLEVHDVRRDAGFGKKGPPPRRMHFRVPAERRHLMRPQEARRTGNENALSAQDL